MPLVIIDEEYDGLESLYANAGKYVDAEVRFFFRFDYVSNQFARATYRSVAGNHWIELPVSDSWDNYGFSAGDNIDLNSTWVYNDGSATYSQAQSWNRNITYISGNQLHIDAALVPVPGGGTPPVGEVADGREFPTDSIVNRFTDLTIIKTDAAQEIEFSFNLTPNGTSSFQSVLDSEVVKLVNNAISGMVVTDTLPLTQVGNKSGGYIESATITFDSHDLVNHYRTYTINYRFMQWGFIQDGFAEPNYFAGTSHLAPIAGITLLGISGNPNTMLSGQTANTQANTGGFDENYNGGVNLYSHVSTEWKDHLGNVISGMDYSNECTFKTYIDAPGQNTNNSTFRIGFVFRPNDSSIYQALPDSVVNNLLVNTPDVDFMHNASTDPTVYTGFANSDGVQFDVTDLQFLISGSTVRVTGKVIPNAAAQAYFDAIPDGGRRETIWISIGDYTVDGTTTSKRVHLKVYDEDLIDAPTPGVQIPDMVGTIMLDHGGNDTDGFDPRYESTVTTEDDVLYQATLKLIDNVAYEGVGLRLEAYNSFTGDEFILEEFFFDFTGVPQISGQFQPNQTINRGFLLPPATDRNIVSIAREPSLDELGKYGIKIDYGFLSRWQYWIARANVDNDFFDVSEPNDGKNEDWQRYSDVGDWNVRVHLFTRVDNVEDFDYHTFSIRPYEDEDVTPTVTYTRLSDGTNPTALPADELIEVEAVLEWNVQDYENSNWAAITLENFEGARVGFISSDLVHGGVASNALEPITGQDRLDLVVVGDLATLKCVVDTSKINVDDVSWTFRIHSQIDRDKITTDDIDKFTTDDAQKEVAL